MSSSIHTPLISLHTPLLNTPHYFLFTPHSIKKYSHPNPIDTPQICSPKPPNPSSPFLLTKTNPQIRRTEHPRTHAHRNQRTLQIRRSSKFVFITQLFLGFSGFFTAGILVPGFGNMKLIVRISLNPVTAKNFGFPMSAVFSFFRT